MKEAEALRTGRHNVRTAVGAFTTVAVMLGVSFAAVPLYDLFCRVTGFGGTPMTSGQPAPGSGPDGRLITIRFNANTQPNLPWLFEPMQQNLQIRLGAEGLALYRAHNLSEATATGISTYNVTPDVVGRYFHKTACFCFEEQTLTAGQDVEMPMVFWVDPRISEDPNTRNIRTITVNYTFFRTLQDAERSGSLANAGPHVGRRDSTPP